MLEELYADGVWERLLSYWEAVDTMHSSKAQ